MNDNETVTITKQEYESLLGDSEFLSALRAGGVDNWEFYDEAVGHILEQE